MSNKAAKRDAIIVLYEGRNTAEKAYGTLERLQEIDRVEIHTAALIYRQPNGKLKV